jgi:ABC-type cobalamin transport system permease subunit
MIETETPHYAFGILTVAIAILYAGIYEFRRKNKQDAKLLLTAGALSITGTALVLAFLIF